MFKHTQQVKEYNESSWFHHPASNIFKYLSIFFHLASPTSSFFFPPLVEYFIANSEGCQLPKTNVEEFHLKT